MSLIVDMKVGESIKIEGVLVQLNAKTGQRISLTIDAPNKIQVKLFRLNNTQVDFLSNTENRRLG